jgi:hypothetical protein
LDLDRQSQQNLFTEVALPEYGNRSVNPRSHASQEPLNKREIEAVRSGMSLAMLSHGDIRCPVLTQDRVMQTTHLPSSGRELVPLTAQAHNERPHPQVRRVSNFLAQLIATARKLPQANAKRRADPAEAVAAYRATVERLHTLKGKSG